MGADCAMCDECEDEFIAMQTRVEDAERRIAAIESRGSPIARLTGDVGRLQRDVGAILGRLPMIEEDVENLENAWKRGASAEPRIAAPESHVTPIPRMEGDVESLGDMWGRIASLEQRVTQIDARLGVEEGWRRDAIFPARAHGAPDLLSFLAHCDGALDCSPDGEIRLIFPEGAPVPLSDLMTAASLLRAHDPEGPIGVAYDGGIVVRLCPTPREDES